MLKKLYVDNFKALNNFEIIFNPVTFIIGANASGKSTILNSIIFLKYCCGESVTKYMDDNKTGVSDICSKFSEKRTITFKATFDFNEKEVIWEIKFTANKSTNTLKLYSETVSSNDNILLRYSSNLSNLFKKDSNFISYRINELTGEKEALLRGEYKFSHINIIGTDVAQEYPTLTLIKKYFDATEPFDLLSPKDMRDSARGKVDSVGKYGEKLAAFVKGLSGEDKDDLVNTIKSIFPNIVDIRAIVRGRPGWAYIEVEEDYNNQNISIPSQNVSDGILRLIAFFAMKYHKNSGGATLLDEIENGINSEILEHLLKSFQKNSEDTGQQFIATTHNTVLLDFVDSKNIRYISRDERGDTIAYNPFENPELQDKLEYLYPGEIILNTPNERLKCLAKNGESESL